MKLKKSYFQSFDKTNKILFVILLALSIVFAGIVLWKFSFQKSNNDFYAVYLKNGELYFGTLSRFPSFTLNHVYVLQNQGGSIQIKKLSNVFWSPEDNLKINRNEVIWYVKLNQSGSLAKTLKTNPDTIPGTPAEIQEALPTNTNMELIQNTATNTLDEASGSTESIGGMNGE
jgi:hypothetical protein